MTEIQGFISQSLCKDDVILPVLHVHGLELHDIGGDLVVMRNQEVTRNVYKCSHLVEKTHAVATQTPSPCLKSA